MLKKSVKKPQFFFYKNSSQQLYVYILFYLSSSTNKKKLEPNTFAISKSVRQYFSLVIFKGFEKHFISQLIVKETLKFLERVGDMNIGRYPVYCSWSTNKTPTPLIFYFCYFFVFILLLGQVCPAGLGKRFSQGPPQGLENEKSKIRGVGYLCSKY